VRKRIHIIGKSGLAVSVEKHVSGVKNVTKQGKSRVQLPDVGNTQTISYNAAGQK